MAYIGIPPYSGLTNSTGTIATTAYTSSSFNFAVNPGWGLVIKPDGNIQWTGSLTKNVKHFINSLTVNLELSKVKRTVMEKYYRKGIEHAITVLENKTKEEAIAALKNEVELRKNAETMHLFQDLEE